MKRFKSVFESKTFWSAVITCGIGINPILVAAAENGGFAPKHIGAIAGVILGTIATIWFRVSATEKIYTPDGLPGANKSDLTQS